MKIFKKIGRIFLICTEEEKHIKSEVIKSILIVNIREAHFDKTLNVVKQRFQFAEIKITCSNAVFSIMAKLWKLREEQFDAVIVLSLNPLVISLIIPLFHCYLLIYNKFDQWFLIRRKTFYEFLAGRRGTDKGNMDWTVSSIRLNLVKFIVMVSFLPIVFIKNIIWSVKLIIYIFINISHLIGIRYYYKFINYLYKLSNNLQKAVSEEN